MIRWNAQPVRQDHTQPVAFLVLSAAALCLAALPAQTNLHASPVKMGFSSIRQANCASTAQITAKLAIATVPVMSAEMGTTMMVFARYAHNIACNVSLVQPVRNARRATT